MVTENVSLPEHQAEFIQRNIEAGDYQDASEVVRAGLRLLQEWQAEKLEREAELRAMLVEAKAGGVSDRTPAEVWAAVEARYENRDA